MDKNNLFKKGIVVCVIVLLLGISISEQPNTKIVKEELVSTCGEILTVGSDGGDTLFVGGGVPGNYDNIQDAIDDASDADIIYVYSGTYNENIEINKEITLIGEDRDTTTINGASSNKHTVKIFGTIVSYLFYVNISGFTIRNVIGATNNWDGIYAEYTDHCSIYDCIVKDSDDGISVKEFNNGDIRRNIINDNNYVGLYLMLSDSNEIIDNIIDNNMEGIKLYYADSNTILENDFTNNEPYGIRVFTGSNYNTLYHNNFANDPNPGDHNAYEYNNDNDWDSGTEGNYWDDFDEPGEGAYDNNSDGIVDSPYTIPGPGGAQDNYPLMNLLNRDNKLNLQLFIEDASLNHGVIWKAPGDRIDIVANIENPSDLDLQPTVIITFSNEQLSSDAKIGCFLRYDFTDTDEVNITSSCSQTGNKLTYQLSSPIPSGGGCRQVIFRIRLPDNAPRNDNLNRVVRGVISVTGYNPSEEHEDYYRVPNYVGGIVVTNRHLLYEKYGDEGYTGGNSEKVKQLLAYIYEIAEGNDDGEKRCIVYNVEHYDESFRDWDQDYDSPYLNAVAQDIDSWIETWIEKHNSFGGYVLIIGGDEIIPFFRIDDPTNVEEEWPISSDDPIPDSLNNGYFISDVVYADTDNWYSYGILELMVGRIIGKTAEHMHSFIQNGIEGPKNNEKSVVANGRNATQDYDPDIVIDKLEDNGWDIIDKITLTDNVDWDDEDLIDALKEGPQIFTHFWHEKYTSLQTGVHDDVDRELLIPSEIIYEVNSNGCISNNNTFVFLDGCRGGVVPNPGHGATCIMHAFVETGVSSGIGSGGITFFGGSGYSWYWPWGLCWGERYGNQFFDELIIDSSETLEIGKAYYLTERNYWHGIVWDDKDHKTLQQYIIYGVPWMKLNCPSYGTKKSGQDDDFSINISDPILLGDGNYSREICINILDYHNFSSNGFDLIYINGTEQDITIMKPQIPVVKIDFYLPNNSEIINVDYVENITVDIGDFNIPCSNITEGTYWTIWTNDTDVAGYHPSTLYSWNISEFVDYEKLHLYVSPIQHNPTTNDTILYNYTKFNITYNISTPIALHEFNINSPLVMGEPIEGFVTLENVGSENLSNLIVNLSVENLITSNKFFNLSSNFSLNSGETTEMSTVIDETISSAGSYLAKVKIIDSNSTVLASSQEVIFVSSGRIVKFDCPERIEPEEPVQFSILFENNNISSVNATGYIYIYNSLYQQIENLTSDPVDVSSGSSAYINITWNTTDVEEDRYIVSVIVNTTNEIYKTSNKILIINPKTVYVDDDYNLSTPGWKIDHFNSIYEGIDAVAENGTVYVYNGTYYENINISKSVNLIGEDKNIITIDGNGTEIVIKVSANRVNISGFTIMNSSCAGIYVDSDYSSVFKCDITNNSNYGIFLNNTSSYNIIYENNIKTNNYGIYLDNSSDDNVLYHNNFINNTQYNAYDNCYNYYYKEEYPVGGNYWDDYNGSDFYSGENQDIPGSDGIGDTPHEIPGEGENEDEYPLIDPYEPDNIPPEITNVSDIPDPVGYGFDITIAVNITDSHPINASGVNMVKVNITYPDNSCGNFTMDNITDDTYEYNFSDTWQNGQYNYTVWAIDNENNSNLSSGHSFNVSANATVNIATLKDSYGANEYINITDPPTPPEDFYLTGRGLTWNQYYNASAGNDVLEVFTGPVNYKNETDEWTPIIPDFQVLESDHPAYSYGYRAGNERGLYNAYFKPNSQDNWPVAFAYNKSDDPTTHVVRSKLVGVGYLDPSQNWSYEYLQSVQNSQGQINDNRIIYEDAFTGTDVIWSYENSGLKEEIIMSNTTKTLLENHPPSMYGLNNTHSYLVIITKLDYQGLTPYNESGDFVGNVTASEGRIKLKDVLDQFKCAFPIEEAYELHNNSVSQRLTYRLIQYGGNYYLLSGLKVASLHNMTFPVVIDPTITLSEMGYDGHILGTDTTYEATHNATTGTVYDAATRFSIGQQNVTISITPEYRIWRGFTVFNTTSIPENTVIMSATLQLYKRYDYSAHEFTITIQNGQPDSPHLPLEDEDYYYENYSGDGGSLFTRQFGDGYNNISLNDDGLSWINTNDLTKLCIRSSRDIAGSAPPVNEYVSVYSSDDVNSSRHPRLIVEYRNQSKIQNVGSTDIKGYLLMQVQYNNSGTWVNDTTVVNDTVQTINSSDQLKLDEIFNGKVNTNDLTNGNGTYRVYIAFRDPEDNILVNDDEIQMAAWYEFEVTY